MTEINVVPPQPKKHTPPNEFIKNRNLKHKYGATRTQLRKKVDGAQFSIEKRHIPPKDTNSQA
jgi:hypothetical protein